MVLRAAAAIALLLLLLAACRRSAEPSGPTATYRLDVTPEAIDVTLSVTGVEKATLTSPGPIERMRVEDLRFHGPNGESLAPRRSAETTYARDEADGREVSRTVEAYSLDPAPHRFTLRYRVRPGHAESGVLAGFIGPAGALFSGDQVFYAMTAEPAVAAPRLEIGALPSGWVAEGIPPLDGSGGVDPWRALFASPIRSGPPPREPGAAAAPPPRDILDAFGETRVLLIDAPPGARRIDVSAGPFAVGMESGPWTERRRRRLARRLVERWFLPRDRALRSEDQWLAVAAPIFLASGSAWPALSERLYREHAATFPGTATSLGESFRRAGASGSAAVRRLRGPLVLGLLDARLAPEGAAAFVRGFLEGPADGRRKGFSAALRERLGDAEAIPFLDRTVGRGGMLLGRASESLEDLAPEPPPGGGPSAREIVLLVTGAGRGYLESCGCQKVPAGGAARRAGAIDAVRRERGGGDGVIVVLDAGDFLPYADPLEADDVSARLEETVVETMNDMGVAAAAVASNEILAGPRRLAALARAARFPFLSANLVASDRFEAGTTIADGLVAVFAASGIAPARVHADYVDEALERGALALVDPVEPLAAAVRAVSAPVRIVIGCLAPERIRELVARAPEIDVVVSTDDVLLRGPESAPRGRDRSGYAGTTLVVYATAGDVALDRIDLRLDAAGRVVSHSAATIALVPGTPEAPAVRERIDRFREFASARRLASATPPEAMTLPGDAALLALPGNGFLGGAACVECHADAHGKWRDSEHAGALETLRRVRRDLDPSCLACHVTRLRYESARPVFEDGVACEACHGPGALHAKEPARKDLLVTPVAPGRCRACHTTERNPSFEGRSDEMIEAIRHWARERERK